MELVETETIGAAWLEVSRRILEDGADATYDGIATKELALVTLVASAPDPDDPVVAAHGDPEWSAWMERNFTSRENVAELGDARSYGARLRNRGDRDQIAWVVERLRADPETRSATITTFEPETDTSYIPCVSLLDFWLRGSSGNDRALELVVYAHSLDFGKKAYGNLVELARLQHEVAERVGVGVGQLVIHAKSAHVYEPEWAAMTRIAATASV